MSNYNTILAPSPGIGNIVTRRSRKAISFLLPRWAARSKLMLTFEDVTGYFLKAAASLELVTHPEYWVKSRSLEREFACTCHTGSCEEAEARSSCTLSFTWSTLDTALSLEGPVGICDFFHEPDEHCPHLHTSDIPPLALDLAYTAPLNEEEASAYATALLSLTQMLKLHASEHSRRPNDTPPRLSLILPDNPPPRDTPPLPPPADTPHLPT